MNAITRHALARARRAEWNTWQCDWLPWRTVGRLDMRIAGYTALVSQGVPTFPPEDAFHAGWAAQFGFTGANARNITITRNEVGSWAWLAPSVCVLTREGGSLRGQGTQGTLGARLCFAPQNGRSG